MARIPSSKSPANESAGRKILTVNDGVARVSIDPSSVVKYVRVGNDLLIHRDSGKIIRVKAFFTADDQQRLELVFVHHNREWPVTAVTSTIPVDDETGREVLFASGTDGSGVGLLGNAGLLGLLGAAAAGVGATLGGGSGGGSGSDNTPAPLAPSLNLQAHQNGTVTASGLSAPGASVLVTFPDGSTKTVLADANGEYRATSLHAQPSGEVTAVTIDVNGKVSPPANADYLDKIAPASPDGVVFDDDIGTVQGLIEADTITDDARPTISGNAEAGSTVTIRDGETVLGTVRADTSGKWSFTPTTPLRDGVHSITITAKDAAGNESAAAGPLQFTVDTSGPDVVVTNADAVDDDGAVLSAIANDGLTRDTTPRLSGTSEAGAKIVIYDNGVQIGSTLADKDGAWSFAPPALAEGNHAFTAQATDTAGNAGKVSDVWTFRVDTTAPEVPVIGRIMDDIGSVTGPLADSAVTDDRRPQLSGSGVTAGDIVTIYHNDNAIGTAVAGSDGRWSFTIDEDLIDGEHEFTVTATDAAGNESVKSTPHMIVVDTEAPEANFVPVIASASDDVAPNTEPVLDHGYTNDTTPRLNGSGAEPNGLVRIYEGSTLLGQAQADSGGNWSFDVPARAQGEHMFTAIAVDVAGNEGSSSALFTLTIDTTAPGTGAATITHALDDQNPVTGEMAAGDVTNDATPTLQGTADADIVLVRIYDDGLYLGQAHVANGTWSFTPEGNLSHGIHNFQLKAVDAAGNEAIGYSQSFSLTLDLLAPNPPTIGKIRDDEGSIKSTVADGASTDDLRPELSGTGAEAGSIVTIYDDGHVLGTTVAADNGSWTFTPATDLEERDYSFTVTATDKAGNEGPHSPAYEITIDRTAPNKPLIISVEDDVEAIAGDLEDGDFTNDRTPRLNGAGAEAGSLVGIYDNGNKIGEAHADSFGNWTFTPLASLTQGAHSFQVSSTDAAGNESEKSDPFTLVVDSIAPNRPVLGAVTDAEGTITGALRGGSVSNDPRPVISGSNAEAGAIITVYDRGEAIGTAVVAVDGTWAMTPEIDLEEGPHQIAISATDMAGNESPRSPALNFTIDTTA
ncbi:Ig-like domain-containing protein, partial [Neorhizobium sp. T786]|uniref:Ig-like domain-containing protein n=1 Tax=Pseudorhizobium xiangyangii TaxID=2883104 RepID=UPI001CFFA54C